MCYEPATGFTSQTWPRASRARSAGVRRIERLPGAVHPAVYRVEYDCACGVVHPGLLSHSDLDYGPLATVEFRNLITGRTEPVGDEWPRSQRHRCNAETGPEVSLQL